MSPKFTIQHMLWATLAFGFVATAMAAAYQGNLIAAGLLIAPLFMSVTFVVLAVTYWSCYAICRLLYPPIHTPAVSDFSGSETPAPSAPLAPTQLPFDNDSVAASPTSPTDANVSEGASE